MRVKDKFERVQLVEIKQDSELDLESADSRAMLR